MQDTIIKGSGNSRTLGSVPNFLTLYPTYEAFAQALINRELPIDLGPVNPAGVDVHGTDLTKSTLLKDTTAALYGKTSAATPDDILAAIRPLITAAQSTANSKGLVQCGSYVGTGTFGPSNPNSLRFSFAPAYVAIVGIQNLESNEIQPVNPYQSSSSPYTHSAVSMGSLSTNYQKNHGLGLLAPNAGKKSADGKTLYWYMEYNSGYNFAGNQFNDANIRYFWVALA